MVWKDNLGTYVCGVSGEYEVNGVSTQVLEVRIISLDEKNNTRDKTIYHGGE